MMHSAAMRSEEIGREAPGSLPSSAPPSMHHCSAAAVCSSVAMTFPEVEERREKGREARPSKSNFPSYVLHLFSPFSSPIAFVPLSLLSLRGICAFLSTCGMALCRLALEEKQTSPTICKRFAEVLLFLFTFVPLTPLHTSPRSLIFVLALHCAI